MALNIAIKHGVKPNESNKYRKNKNKKKRKRKKEEKKTIALDWYRKMFGRKNEITLKNLYFIGYIKKK